jgi:hypothetical protein
VNKLFIGTEQWAIKQGRRVGQEPRGSFPPSERSVRLSPHCAQA